MAYFREVAIGNGERSGSHDGKPSKFPDGLEMKEKVT